MPFELDKVKSGLRVPGLDLKYVEETGSTNADLLSAADAKPGTVLIAGTQSAGRGRMRREFASPEGGLYMSVLLEPHSADEALLITPSAAVAAALAIDALTGSVAGIKWVNDILLHRKKVCGILAEAVAGERMRVVLGIGANVSAVPSGLEEIAGSFFPDGRAHAREELASAILNRLFEPPEDVYGEYLRRSVVLGRSVTVHRGGESYAARALDIDRSFRLVVEHDGKIEALNSGEVSVRL